MRGINQKDIDEIPLSQSYIDYIMSFLGYSIEVDQINEWVKSRPIEKTEDETKEG